MSAKIQNLAQCAKTNKTLFFLISLGLVLRIVTLKSIGGVDSEWWKAWMSATEKFGVLNIYTDTSDLEYPILSRLAVVGHLEPFPIYFGQRIVDYVPFEYGRSQFPITQPPLFLLDMNLVERLSQLLQTTRMISYGFNTPYVALNFTGLIWTALLVIIVRYIYTELLVPKPTNWAVITIWINPALILSSPIQGFRDIPMLTLICTSVLFIVRGNKRVSGLFYGFAIMTKLTAIFALPGLIWTKFNPKFISATFIAVAIVILPYIFNGTFIGLLQGQLSNLGNLRRVNGDVSIWAWLQLFDVQYLSDLGNGGGPFTQTFFEIIPRLAVVAQILILALIIFRFRRASSGKVCEKEPLYWVAGFAISIALHLSRLNAQDNHWVFVLATFFPGIIHKRTRVHLIALITILTTQDLLTQGLGRSYFESIWVLMLNYSAGASVILSVFAVLILIRLIILTEDELSRNR